MAGRAQHGRAAENCRANIARIGSTTADVGSSTNQRERGPGAIGELERAALVARMHARAVRPGGAEGEPERVIERAMVNAGVNV